MQIHNTRVVTALDRMMEQALSAAAEAEAEEAFVGGHMLGRMGRPDELRGVAVWLASDASYFCTGSE